MQSLADARVVLIIDDIGHSFSTGKRALALEGNVNYAVLPHTPNGNRLARLAAEQGKEVLLHMPMASSINRHPGPGALTPAMDRDAFLESLRSALESLPQIKGVSNHMGSELTRMQQPMEWLMGELNERGLYFVDSRTTHLTVAEEAAAQSNVPYLRRLVFLDNIRDEDAIGREFDRLLILAERHGVAAAIGHPHPETLSFLENNLPRLAERGIELALVSEVIN